MNPWPPLWLLTPEERHAFVVRASEVIALVWVLACAAVEMARKGERLVA